MAYSYVGAATAVATRTPVVSRPANVAAGDLLIAHVYGNGQTYTGPTGWTLVHSAQHNPTSAGGWAIFSRVATSSEASTYSFSCSDANGNCNATVSAHRGTAGAVEYAASTSLVHRDSGSVTLTAPSLPATAYANAPALFLFTGGPLNGTSFTRQNYSAGYSFGPTSGSELMAMSYFAGQSSLDGIPGGAQTHSQSTTGTQYTGAVSLRLTAPAPPYAPAQTAPAQGAVLDRSVTNRFAWTHSDANNDPQTAYALRYRVTGTTDWTTLTDTTSNQYRDIAGGTFAAGDYEWQVATNDVGGTLGSWSSTGLFTARNAVVPPTITAPTSGGTAGPTPVTLSWTVPEQDAYQWRRVKDTSGAPDSSVVYQAPDPVTSSGERSTTVLFETNGRTEWLQLRVQRQGLWSAWSSVSQVVNYTPPAASTGVLTADNVRGSATEGTLLLTITDPTPSGSQPTVVSHDIYVDDGDGQGSRRLATGVGATWRHWTPTHLRNYNGGPIRVVAIGASGATTTTVI